MLPEIHTQERYDFLKPIISFSNDLILYLLKKTKPTFYIVCSNHHQGGESHFLFSYVAKENGNAVTESWFMSAYYFSFKYFTHVELCIKFQTTSFMFFQHFD